MTLTGGQPVIETMFHPGSYPDNYLSSAAATDNGSRVVAMVCNNGCAALKPEDPWAATRLLESLDGGETWTELGEFDGTWAVLRATDSRAVLLRNTGFGFEVFEHPTMTPLEPPGTAIGWPFSGPNGEWVWLDHADRRFVGEDGGSILRPRWGPDVLLTHYAPLPGGNTFAAWTEPGTAVEGRDSWAGVIRSDGIVQTRWRTHVDRTGNGEYVWAVWGRSLPDGRIWGSSLGEEFLFDPYTGEMRFVHLPTVAGFLGWPE